MRRMDLASTATSIQGLEGKKFMNLWLKNLLVPAIASYVCKESQSVNIISPLVSSRPVNNNSLRATHFFLKI